MQFAASRLPWLALVLGNVLLLWFHVAGLLKRPHFQFVVVVPLLVWILWVSRRESGEVLTSRRSRGSWIAVAGLFGSLFGLAVCSLFWSPWGAVVCALGAAFFHLGLWVGWKQFRRWAPAWLMCCVIVPLPFGWDERVTVLLRGVTTRLTSRMLDFLGVLHVSYMNIIEVPSKRLFIADACSGVHSLYVLLAASLFWALLNRRSILHIVMLCGSTIGIVLVENIARLVIIVVALRWQVDLSSGPDHAVLGMFLFLTSAGLIISTDQFLLFLLPDFAAKFGAAKPGHNARKKADSEPQRSVRRAQIVSYGIYALFPLCGILQYTRMPGSLPDLTSSFRSPPELKILGESGLPESIGDFRRLEYSEIKRVFGDPFGQQSQQWVYTAGQLTAQVSIDYPFDGMHDSAVCYNQVGWTIDFAEPVEDPETAIYVMAKMSRPLEGEALLMFSQIDQDGKIHARLKDSGSALKIADAQNRLRALLKGPDATQEVPARLPLIQVQLLARSSGNLTDEDLNRVSQFYCSVRSLVADQLGLATPQSAVDSVTPSLPEGGSP